MGCRNTYYVSPTEDTMGYALMLNGDRGAAAVDGANTFTEAVSEQALSRESVFAFDAAGQAAGGGDVASQAGAG